MKCPACKFDMAKGMTVWLCLRCGHKEPRVIEGKATAPRGVVVIRRKVTKTHSPNPRLPKIDESVNVSDMELIALSKTL